MLFKYSGKYVNIYFNMKITFPSCQVNTMIISFDFDVQGTSDLIEIEVNHFGRTMTSIHTRIYLRFR